MKALRLGVGLSILLTVALLSGSGRAKASGSGQAGPPQLPDGAATPPLAVKAQPSPFLFDIDEINLKFGDRVVLHDSFEQGGLGLTVNLGKVSASNLRDGVLRIDNDATTNVWLGPGGTYGHRLHRHDVYVALLTLPIEAAGSTFVAGEAFPLEYSVRLRKPRFGGFEKLKIGLLDVESFKSVAAIAVGRLTRPASARGEEAGPKVVNLLDLASHPAVALNRVEEPEVTGEIVLDHAGLERFQEIDTLDMTLRVGRDGRLSGAARIAAGGRVSEINLEPRIQEPAESVARRSSVPPNARLSASIFIETLPKPEVFRVEPREMPIQDLRRAGTVRLRIEGIGFGPDTRVEMVPQGGRGEPIKAGTVQLARKVRGPEGAVLLVDVGLPQARADSYSLRLTTGGQSAVITDAVRVF